MRSMIRKPTSGKSARRCRRRATMSEPSPITGMIHIIGGRFNTFEYNTDLHHVYLPALDTWKERAPLPTPRSGHGLVIYRDRFFAMGGEYGVQDRGQISQGAVFGQMESYDPATNTWQSHAPMTDAEARGGRHHHRRCHLRCGRRSRDRRRGPVVRARGFYAGRLTALAASLPLAQLGNRHQCVLTNAASRSLQDRERG